MKLKIFKDKEDKYHLKTKDNRHIDIEHKDKRLKFKLHKWNKESSIEAVLDMVEADTHKFSENKIEVEDSKKKVRVYPIDVHGGDGGLRFELVYKEKPPTYPFTVPLVCTSTRWSKQPFLTQEDRDRGTRRPEKVEGSFAVYHASKKNNEYMTGKMLHVYRPIVTDALGNWAWCEIDVDRYINPTSLTVTPPQQFMDEATYPVTVDPDFGYTVVGMAGIYTIADETQGVSRRAGSAWAMPAPGGTANYIRACIGAFVTSTPDCKVFINQKDSGGAGIHGQIATDENLACAAAFHWEEFTLSGEVLVQGVDYILSVTADVSDMEAGDGYLIKFDTNGAVASYKELQNYGTPENPWVVDPPGDDYSIYCNYSVEEEPEPVTIQYIVIFGE